MLEALQNLVDLINDNFIEAIETVINNTAWLQAIIQIINNFLTRFFGIIKVDNAWEGLTYFQIASVLGLILLIVCVTIFIRLVLNIFKAFTKQLRKNNRYK